MQLSPTATLSESDCVAGQRALVWDTGWAAACGTLSGGVVLASFAIALNAGPLTIGLIGAIPLLSQAFQIPGIALVDRLRQRKRIAVVLLTVARSFFLLMAAIPFVADASARIPLLVASQIGIGVLSSLSACAINSWIHQFLPKRALGGFFSRSLVVSTVLSSAGTLMAGGIVERLRGGSGLSGYAIVFSGAAVAGFASTFCLVLVPEPTMQEPMHEQRALIDKLRAPFADRNFRRLITMLGAWNCASNLVAPFLTVFLMRQLGLTLGMVTLLWVSSQMANALTLFAWGRVSDRMTNKSVLALAFPVWFGCVLSLVFADALGQDGLQLTMLFAVHMIMGAAGGGIGLAVGNLGLKLAPQGQGTAYLATLGWVSAAAGGVAPLIGGLLAEHLSRSELSIVVRFAARSRVGEWSVLSFAHWEFLFALSFLLGLYVLHALSRIEEDHQPSGYLVIQELALETLKTINHISSLGGTLGNLMAFGRFFSSIRGRRPGDVG